MPKDEISIPVILKIERGVTANIGNYLKDAGIEQVRGIAVPFEGAGYPQTVDIHVIRSVDRDPGIFRRDVFDEAFAAFDAFQKDEAFVKAVGQPGFFGRDLNVVVIGYGAADVLLFQIFLCNANVFHVIPFYRKRLIIFQVICGRGDDVIK